MTFLTQGHMLKVADVAVESYSALDLQISDDSLFLSKVTAIKVASNLISVVRY